VKAGSSFRLKKIRGSLVVGGINWTELSLPEKSFTIGLVDGVVANS
jgi:hypothetical protein